MLPLVDLKEMGIGLAAAVLIDATIVRAVLLPATMKLLGEKNWYLPSWLAVAAAPRARALSRAGSTRRRRSSPRLGATATRTRSHRLAPVRPHASHRRRTPKCSALRSALCSRGSAPARLPAVAEALHSDVVIAGSALGVVALHVARRQLPPAAAGHVGRRPPRQRSRAARRCSSLAAVVYPRLRAGAPRGDRAPRRPPRDRGRGRARPGTTA